MSEVDLNRVNEEADKDGDRWQAVVRINGRLTWLGVFESEADAAAIAAPHFAGIEA